MNERGWIVFAAAAVCTFMMAVTVIGGTIAKEKEMAQTIERLSEELTKEGGGNEQGIFRGY